MLLENSVFGLLKRGGKVYTKIILDVSSATFYPIIERKVVPNSIVYTDCGRGYNVLDVSKFEHFRINHSKLFADLYNHINGIDLSTSSGWGLLESGQASFA